MRPAEDSSNQSSSPHVAGGGDSSSLQCTSLTSRLEVIRSSFGRQGIPSQVVDILMAGSRDSTKSAYESAWSNWYNWCLERHQDPLSCSLNTILEYLSNLHLTGKAYSTINVHRSMLSMTLDPINGIPVGKHPLIIKLMKGCFNRNPPKPKYSVFWEVDKVLNFMKSMGENEDLCFSKLSKKLTTLLAIVTMMRTSELASIDKESIRFSSSGASFSLAKPRKTQFNGCLKTFSFPNFSDRRICPVVCLGLYMVLSDYLRTDDNNSYLFVGLKTPNNTVSSNTIGRWIKSFLKEAGIDTEIFSAHSTQGAVASKAAKAGVSIDSILRAGDWNRKSTFTRFYRRDLDSESVGPSNVLSSSFANH